MLANSLPDWKYLNKGFYRVREGSRDRTTGVSAINHTPMSRIYADNLDRCSQLSPRSMTHNSQLVSSICS